MKLKLGIVAAGALMFALSGCGSDEPTSEVQPSVTAVSSVPATTTTVALPLPSTADNSIETVAPEPVPQPTIVGCQEGYNPVQTTWSDGTVTGYSDYCQSVRDQFIQNEVPPESGPKQYVCESGLPCGITEDSGVVCDENGCRDTRTG